MASIYQATCTSGDNPPEELVPWNPSAAHGNDSLKHGGLRYGQMWLAGWLAGWLTGWLLADWLAAG